jgi:acetolactate synthase-1/2/3 large subunit
MGLGDVDTANPLSLHMLGMHGAAYANYAVDDADFIFAVGARFDDRVAGVPAKFAPHARFIAQVDIDPAEVSKRKQVQWHHIGLLSATLEQLTEYGKAHGVRLALADWHAHVADLKRNHAMNYNHTSDRIQPQAVIEAINRHTHGNAIVSTGVGQHQMWAAQYLELRKPRHFLTSGSMGTMGFGLPAAIGAQFARPDALVIDVDGDGSIRMNIGELETLTTYNLPVKVLLLNNVGDGKVRQRQKLFFKSRFSATDKSLRHKDFIKAAEADGFTWARRLERPEALEATLTEFLDHAGPAFLEVMIDPDAGVYPMVGPGASYAEMITGKYITPRDPSVEPPSDIPATSMF